MTPKEAVKQMAAKGVPFKNHRTLEVRAEEIVAACIGDETRRCAARVLVSANFIEHEIMPTRTQQHGKTVEQTIVSIVRQTANDILTTGGLEVEETDAKMKE